MRKSLPACMLLFGVANSAFAQRSVTLYGSLDEAIGYVSNQKGGHTWTMGASAVPEWLGLRGIEDLGGGLAAVFNLEDGFASATGMNLVPNTAFGRKAYVGLSSPYGTVTMGRQLDLTNESLMPLSNGFLQYNYQMYHPGNLDDIGTTSVNNAVKYISPTYSGVTVLAMYGLNDATTQPSRYVGAAVNYDNGPLKLTSLYSALHDRSVDLASKLGYTNFLGQRLIGGAVFNARSMEITGVAGFYQLSQSWTMHALYTHIGIDTDSTSGRMNNAEAGVEYHTSPFNMITLGYDYSSLGSNHYHQTGTGDVYFLSKSTLLFGTIAYQHASSGVSGAMALLVPSSTQSQLVMHVGVQHFF